MLNKFGGSNIETMERAIEQLKKDVEFLKSQIAQNGLSLPIGRSN